MRSQGTFRQKKANQEHRYMQTAEFMGKPKERWGSGDQPRSQVLSLGCAVNKGY